ncbi:transposase [Pseudarthrobacter phenanthrenivorans Sphe3]|uniref:Transposase n=1 Tax=Pseudarthrobacter phenanthrenivorans (strain DSM 18606 / JCM 16027 / LMG 23796 / Sphe3) TaxID=930171 RepID=F0M1Q4_PSEPM|nr:IS3 family transposase [Pseudarthrobacter phenanthrenivorans]ADX72000.1 transposase [Pseudarthrobacter phenanthrenivorans Sphe3]ADX73338.1 transposase [Pseudarthrobacter phenanthrenivorans Sphe3]ADX73341.1 transposase [Pseudarthrobacter phenanthrenivorans Sphe3]
MYRVVQEKNADFPVAWMCRQLDLPRATYYRWLDAAETPTALRRRELTDQVKTVFDSSDGIFGHRMVHTKLAAAGIEVSVGTVAGIMAENGWVAKRMRAFKRTTIPSDPDKVFADLIGRDFTAEAPGTRLVGDITYLRTDEGWLYLATVIDLCTRMVVGWAMAEHMRASLVTGALTMARDRGHLSPNAIFHSDHGTQYTSREMGAWCAGNNIRQSMGATGVCWDNAVAESLFSSLKNEFYHHHSFTTRQDARLATMRYIEVFYNRWRPHTNNEGLPPATAMANFTTRNQQLPAAA